MQKPHNWTGKPPELCDFCKEKITNMFIDGQTIYGPWAIMCPHCFVGEGIGLGEGKGQLYELAYVKTKG